MTFHFLNGVANDAYSEQKNENYIIIASLKSETMGKLINRIPGLRLLISEVYQAGLQERMLNRRASLAMSTSILDALPGKLDIKRHSVTRSFLYFSIETS